MTDGSQGGPPPGWYEDASSADRLRWWNGAAWTEDYRPVTTDAAATDATDLAGGSGATPGGPVSRAQLRARRAAESDAAGAGAGAGAAPGDPSGVLGAGRATPAHSLGEEPHAPAVWPAPSSLGEESLEPPQVDTVGEAPAAVAGARVDAHAAAVWPAPSSLAEPAAKRDEASADQPSTVPESEPSAPAPTPPIASVPRASAPGEVATNGSRDAKGETVPDQITPRRPAPVDDRLPPPIVYQPVSSSYVGEMRPPLPEASPANIPARASIALIVVAALGGLAVVFWLGGWNETFAGMVCLASVAFAAGAFFLAIGGLIVATQRRTSKLLSGIAVAVSIVLVAWLVIVATQQALAILS
ncbi:DUF2510 domain-containing protein [Microbacterium trichothecenolyticum]|uniref:DUF2510 domain-containing protein n=1 Tax=Microbacterium trichothecenolyticum TaxID=69370 RepID=UPI001C6EFD7A|nr:DUF2510 domain-containing protein [Microbacterium trichothecenolyticum]MBW9120586.1 DUF2510 domain-containing protein [Microbacterium trichothecenolyticum]